jgi:cytochrome c553
MTNSGKKKSGMIKYRPYIVGAIGGVLVAATVPLTGIVDFNADNRQWGITDWYLSTAAQQSITLQSAGLAVPDLDDPAALRRAAGHYEMVCATCHGSPAGPPELFADHIRAAPPRLMEQMAQWHPDARVFWTVKHGIKHTAMPAWPTELRDDEVWDMVAFLAALPELDAEAYAALTGAEPGTCASCHGANGEGTPAAPRLDIQSPQYLAAALEAYRQGTRASGTMMTVARRLTDEDIATLSQYFGREAEVEVAPATGIGAEIAARGVPDRDIAACDSCHAGSRAEYPRLLGQQRHYLATQLELFNEHGAARGGSLADIMAHAIRRLPKPEEGPLQDDEIRALADHYGR